MEIPLRSAVSGGRGPSRGHQLGLEKIEEFCGWRAARGEYWLGRWTGLAEQGGLTGSFSRAPESNYCIRECRYLRYREYRWALKARLNLLPVASHERKYGGTAADTRCRGCTGSLETQEYCLSSGEHGGDAIPTRPAPLTPRERHPT